MLDKSSFTGLPNGDEEDGSDSAITGVAGAEGKFTIQEHVAFAAFQC